MTPEEMRLRGGPHPAPCFDWEVGAEICERLDAILAALKPTDLYSPAASSLESAFRTRLLIRAEAAEARVRELEAELRVSRAAQAAEYTSRCEALDKVDRLRESRRKWRELCIEFKTTWNWHSVSDWICRRDALAASDAAEEKQP